MQHQRVVFCAGRGVAAGVLDGGFLQGGSNAATVDLWAGAECDLLGRRERDDGNRSRGWRQEVFDEIPEALASVEDVQGEEIPAEGDMRAKGQKIVWPTIQVA